jgi:hypothetical protein
MHVSLSQIHTCNTDPMATRLPKYSSLLRGKRTASKMHPQSDPLFAQNHDQGSM